MTVLRFASAYLFRITVLGAWGVALAMGAGCSLSPETIRAIEGEPGREGTGIMFSKLPRAIRILATYQATEAQRRVAEERARAIQAQRAGTGQERLIAVDTAPDERSRGAASVMIWDTRAEEIVGNSVYDIGTRPDLGQVAMWDTHSAEYVGTGQTL